MIPVSREINAKLLFTIFDKKNHLIICYKVDIIFDHSCLNLSEFIFIL